MTDDSGVESKNNTMILWINTLPLLNFGYPFNMEEG